jgi:cytochrome c oxidase subunit 3
MAQTATVTKSLWEGGRKPYKATYGKLMMWFFLMSDAFTFSTLLVTYGAIRFASHTPWANPENVFTHFAGLYEWFHIEAPLAFVGLMTFILIASSVTMVLAVEAGHRMDQKQVEKYMIYTIIGGLMFLGCQAYEWFHFISGTHGAHHIAGAIHLVDGTVAQFMPDGALQVMNGTAHFGANLFTDATLFQELVPQASIVASEAAKGLSVASINPDAIISGANLTVNQYAQNPSFANLFFFITGFHGTHVASGVFLNFLIYKQTKSGELHRRGHYEMVEKVGLYWHFVDLVWVFVFTFFYLV